MNRCLKDQMLLLLHDGEGTSAERAHLTECAACAKRYRQLGSDLEAITRTLREARPPQTVSSYSSPWTVRWLTAAVMAAWALVVVWQGIRIWSPPAPAPANEEIWTVMEELSPEQLTQNQAGAEDLWIVLAESYERAAALEVDRPCEWYDVPAREAEAVDAESGDVGAPLPACVELSRL
ncbi:MAG TPA: hypothetical protein VGL70_10160 [Candidatus Binatia bacterium]|jgi:hypothetical protein